MIRLSVDVIWSSHALLKRISEYSIRTAEDIYIKNLSPVSVDTLMDLAVTCRWIARNNDLFVLSKQGQTLVNTKEFSERAKIILSDYICYVTPAWARRIPYGRQEAFIFMTKDEQACFYEAGLMDENPGNTVIGWWDQISNFLRRIEEDRKIEIGRKGEQLTILYEQKRTGRDPQWISLDSNLSGYDVISQQTQDDPSALLIEVKSSEKSIATADFFVSVNEWHTALNTENYKLYLWCFYGGKKQLAIIQPRQLFQYIPTNNKSGKWQMVRIPFASFSEAFKEIV